MVTIGEQLSFAPVLARLRAHGDLRCPRCRAEQTIGALYRDQSVSEALHRVLGLTLWMQCRRCGYVRLVYVVVLLDATSRGDATHAN